MFKSAKASVLTMLLFLGANVRVIDGKHPEDNKQCNEVKRGIGRRRGEIDVMTANLYVGASYDRVSLEAAKNPIDLPAVNSAILTTLSVTAKSDFEARAERIADIITKRNPDVVALQEVATVACVDMTGGAACEVNADIAGAFVGDYLDVLLAKLNTKIDGRGDDCVRYRVAATATNVDPNTFALPFSPDGSSQALLKVGDRDVILVRDGSTFEVVDFGCEEELKTADGCLYQALIETGIPIPGLDSSRRSYVGIDISFGDDGRTYRIVNTHLEVSTLANAFQSLQAAELVEVTLRTLPSDDGAARALVVLGDFNSDPMDGSNNSPPYTWPCQFPFCPDSSLPTPYRALIEQGFIDVWAESKYATDKDGSTFGHDEDLSNKDLEFSRRIDHIFSLEVPDKVRRAKVLGIKKKDKTESDLWPSDHGFVAATLRFSN